MADQPKGFVQSTPVPESHFPSKPPSGGGKPSPAPTKSVGHPGTPSHPPPTPDRPA